MNLLASLGNKDGLTDTATSLLALDPGWKFFGSKGTAAHLEVSGIKATDIGTLVGDPSPGHLVVTLSQLHFGILCDRGNPEHMTWLDKHGLPYTDFVWVGLYDLEGALRNNSEDENAVKAATDMGGAALLRSGAKGRRLVSSSLAITKIIIEWFRAGRPNEEGFRTWLAWLAEERVARYTQASANYLFSRIRHNGGIPDMCPSLRGPEAVEAIDSLLQ